MASDSPRDLMTYLLSHLVDRRVDPERSLHSPSLQMAAEAPLTAGSEHPIPFIPCPRDVHSLPSLQRFPSWSLQCCRTQRAVLVC